MTRQVISCLEALKHVRVAWKQHYKMLIITRLSSKESTLSVAITNTEQIRSTYEDADFAKEQMEVLKMQILQ